MRNQTSSSSAWLPGGSTVNDDNTDYVRNLRLYRALDSGDWERSKHLLHDNVTASLSPDGDTPLHVAVLAGHVEIVEGLVAHILPREALLIKNKSGATSLNYAAIGGITRIAECLVRRAPELLRIPNQNGHIPVVVASLYGHNEMVRYLYHTTPKDEMVGPDGSRTNGAMLLTSCIVDGLYDIALDLLRCCPQLAFVQDSDKDTALEVLARTPSAFPSGAHLAFWKWWIYSCIKVPRISFGNEDIDHQRRPKRKRTLVRQALHKLLVLFSKSLKYLVPGFKHLYDLKWTHVQAQELLRRLCRELSALPDPEFEQTGIQKALFDAISHGIEEFVVEMIRHYPDIVWREDDNQRGIFLCATLHRQEKIFSLIYKMGAKKNAMATSWDMSHNNILHQAAFLAPPSRLDRVTGAALQMQRELQWYKEVESIVQPKHREMMNVFQDTPKILFTKEHRGLVEEGEKWMKETATSCTVVAALIATIMFSALFTVPGGFDQYTGLPIFLHRNSFLVFVICDAISLFASSSSMLMFLGMLTSRYREEDFLRSLPTKLIIGLSTLFFSMATMMITFGVSLVIFLRERFSWITFPIILLASVPVTLFALLQFPLLVDIFLSTYGPGIFDKPNKKHRFL
ncbi:Ankyrin repeat-containing protein NPR4 [Linum grandiflorum]